jgi:hypothetical protein
VASLAEYTKNLYEDDITNRLEDSISLFNQLVNWPQFASVPFVLVLSKVDLLQDALDHYPLKKIYPEYKGGNNMQQAIEFIKNLYLAQYEGYENQKIIPVVGSLVDVDEASKVLDVVVNVAVRNKKV